MEADLQRFIDAQNEDYAQALSEIRLGVKRSHWIWYIFPQIKGLGFSYNSEYYGISSLQEARNYLNHELLGKRLIEITASLLLHKGKDIEQIMGDTIQPGDIFGEVLDEFYSGERCRRTLEFLYIP